MSKSRSIPEQTIVQIGPNDATTRPPLTRVPSILMPPGAFTWEGGGRRRERSGLPENGVLVAHPLWQNCSIDNPVSLCPGFLLDLPVLTLSPSDPLSRWASSGQQPQQQHIPTWALPSSKPPWHCLALLFWRQTLPAPGLRLVRIGGHRACSPGVPAPEE